MGFTKGTVSAAFARQCRKDGQGLGAFCAKCGENVGPTTEPYHMSSVPIAKGGRWNKENCIILCKKCFLEIGFDHPEIISWDDLPYYRG